MICGIWQSLGIPRREKQIRTPRSPPHVWRVGKREKMKQRIYFARLLWHLTCKCYGFIQRATKVGVITFEYFYCRELVYSSGRPFAACFRDIYVYMRPRWLMALRDRILFLSHAGGTFELGPMFIAFFKYCHFFFVSFSRLILTQIR